MALAATSARAAPPEPEKPQKRRMLVLDFGASLGIDPELAKLLGQMVVGHLHDIEGQSGEVMSSSAMSALLKHTETKQIAGCTDDKCLSDLGGVLGAEWLVSGSVSQLSNRPVLTLRLLDVKQSRLANQLTETLPAEAAEYDETVRVATFRLLDLPVPPRAVPWYANGWLWGGAGAAAVALAVGGFLLLRPPSVPDTPLGTVVLDG
jgi:hypothetical protein